MDKREFINDLVEKKDRVIPVIGWKSFVAVNNGIEISLQKYIIDKMVFEDSPEKNIMQEKGYYGIGLLQKYKRLKNNEFKSKLNRIVEEGEIKLRDGVRTFLEAGKFDVVVTTVPFRLLEKEFPTLYGREENVVNFIPSNCNGIHFSEELKRGSLYKIFGDIKGSCVLTEKDLLHYLHQLNNPNCEQGLGAAPLVKYIRKRENCLLMPIGCGELPNWIFRFLLYPFYNTSDLDYIGGIWYKQSNDADFLQYLEDYNFMTLDDPNNEMDSLFTEMAEHLTKEMRRKISSLGVKWSYSGWDYFISYASEDEEIANVIYNNLTERGYNVWLDNRILAPGDEYWEAIQYGIDNSERCIFVITNKYIEKANTKIWDNEGHISGVFKEIECIKEHCSRTKGSIYAIPLIVKNTIVTINEVSQPLNENLLEELHTKKEYQMLQTCGLFEKKQAEIIDNENINEILSKL